MDRDWARDMITPGTIHLGYELQLKDFVDRSGGDADRTPSVDWPERPRTSVGRLLTGPMVRRRRGGGLPAAQLENAVFDPWSGLLDHRPLGDVMRPQGRHFASEKGAAPLTAHGTAGQRRQGPRSDRQAPCRAARVPQVVRRIAASGPLPPLSRSLSPPLPLPRRVFQFERCAVRLPRPIAGMGPGG